VLFALPVEVRFQLRVIPSVLLISLADEIFPQLQPDAGLAALCGAG
jgi:hypothetical protein